MNDELKRIQNEEAVTSSRLYLAICQEGRGVGITS
jgi:hypothetical protein